MPGDIGTISSMTPLLEKVGIIISTFSMCPYLYYDVGRTLCRAHAAGAGCKHATRHLLLLRVVAAWRRPCVAHCHPFVALCPLCTHPSSSSSSCCCCWWWWCCPNHCVVAIKKATASFHSGGVRQRCCGMGKGIGILSGQKGVCSSIYHSLLESGVKGIGLECQNQSLLTYFRDTGLIYFVNNVVVLTNQSRCIKSTPPWSLNPA